MKSLIAGIRLVIVTQLICVAGYTALILGFAQTVTPGTAAGSLIKDKDGKIIGSHLIAQRFTNAAYFWPRPSAVNYNAAGAGASNKSPTSTNLTERARQLIARYEASVEKPLPANLAASSGSGLDPHITEHAALYQTERIAKARALAQSQVEALVKKQAFAPGGALTPDRLVNVLELNLALDGVGGK